MNWQRPKDLSLALRDQGLCDCLAARANFGDGSLKVAGRQTTFAHVVVAKCQQSIEKILKGYLLWHNSSFDPTKGHSPLEDAFQSEVGPPSVIQELCSALNRINRKLVSELKWLESLAPARQNSPTTRKGNWSRSSGFRRTANMRTGVWRPEIL